MNGVEELGEETLAGPSSENVITNRLSANKTTTSIDVPSPLITDTMPKTARFNMGEVRTDLEEDGQYTRQEIDVNVNEYKNRFRSIHHRNYKTQVNRVLGLNDNVIGEICLVLKELLKFYRTAFRFNIAFGKLLHS